MLNDKLQIQISLMWNCTVCKGRAYLGSAGPGLTAKKPGDVGRPGALVYIWHKTGFTLMQLNVVTNAKGKLKS